VTEKNVKNGHTGWSKISLTVSSKKGGKQAFEIKHSYFYDSPCSKLG